jgi:signal transduction histidine kinase
MPDAAMTRNYSKQLLLCTLLLLPLSYLADCALDAFFFGEETLARQIFHPTAHALASRLLFGTFIVIIFILALHSLRKSTQLETFLRKRNEELNLNNQELEAFNYALSHDLRNSLTIIYTSMEMLRDHCQLGKHQECHYLLSSICKYSEKMENQIDSMLLLATASSQPLQTETVLLDRLAREIVDELLHSREKIRPTFEIADHLQANCNKNLIRMGLENLFSNAIKFIPQEGGGVIEFDQKQLAGETIFYIRDNGIGFDKQLAEQIFEPFTRLPEASSLPGTGIGLATVRRIIERHDGRVWAQGAPGQGATFFFTLAPPV